LGWSWEGVLGGDPSGAILGQFWGDSGAILWAYFQTCLCGSPCRGAADRDRRRRRRRRRRHRHHRHHPSQQGICLDLRGGGGAAWGVLQGVPTEPHAGDPRRGSKERVLGGGPWRGSWGDPRRGCVGCPAGGADGGCAWLIVCVHVCVCVCVCCVCVCVCVAGRNTSSSATLWSPSSDARCSLPFIGKHTHACARAHTRTHINTPFLTPLRRFSPLHRRTRTRARAHYHTHTRPLLPCRFLPSSPSTHSLHRSTFHPPI
jgi:hypothetical protein